MSVKSKNLVSIEWFLGVLLILTVGIIVYIFIDNDLTVNDICQAYIDSM